MVSASALAAAAAAAGSAAVPLTGRASALNGSDIEFEFKDKVYPWMCPTLQEEPTSWPIWLLVVEYAAIFLVSATLLIAMRDRSAIFTIRNNFLMLLTLYSLFRIVLFTIHFEWSLETLLLFGSGLPLYFNYVIFSLLIVFLVKVLLEMQGREHLINKALFPIYIVITVALGATMVIVCMVSGRPDKDKGYDYFLAFYGSAVFGFLSLLLGITGFQTFRMLSKFLISHTTRRSLSGVIYMVVMYWIVFVGRCLWNISYCLDENVLQRHMNELQKENVHMYYVTMLVFLSVFEVLPTLCLLYTLKNYMVKVKLRTQSQHDPVNESKTEETPLI